MNLRYLVYLPPRSFLTTSETSARDMSEVSPNTSDSASSSGDMSVRFGTSSKCSFHRPMISQVRVSSSPPLPHPSSPALYPGVSFQSQCRAWMKGEMRTGTAHPPTPAVRFPDSEVTFHVPGASLQSQGSARRGPPRCLPPDL